MTSVRNQRGLSFVSVLLALLIAAALYFGYFRMSSTSGEKAVTIQALDASKAVACRTQRQQMERDIIAYAAEHGDPPTSLSALQSSAATCPEGGTYSLAGTHVTCSKHP